MPDRRVLAAILFVLRTGCQWKALDATDLGSGSTAHRRFQEWVRAGLFYRLWRVAARRYDEVQGLDWRWLSVDGCLTKAPLSRSEVVGRNPTDRGKQGVKRSLLVDGNGMPLALALGPANRNDHLLLAETLDDWSPVAPLGQLWFSICAWTWAMMMRVRDGRPRSGAMSVISVAVVESSTRNSIRVRRRGAGWSSARMRGSTASVAC